MLLFLHAGDFNNKQEEKRDAGEEKSTQSITGKYPWRVISSPPFAKADKNMSYQQASDEAINYKWHFKESVMMSGYTFYINNSVTPAYLVKSNHLKIVNVYIHKIYT